MTDFISDSIDGRVWSGHSCPLALILGLMLIFVFDPDSSNPRTNVKGSGQECPLYTNPDAKS
jgi:hypothetical protein